MSVLSRLDIVVSEEDYPLAQALVAQHISFGWEEESLPSGETRIRVHCPQKTVLDDLAACLRGFLPQAELNCTEVAECDWVAAWKEFFTPVEAGDFLILPPWRAEEGKDNAFALFIEPKSAFGTGHHPTTTLCLEAISLLNRKGGLSAGKTFLDLGTGTGVLGIACAKLGMSGLGVDIDPVAVANAEENRVINNVQALFEVSAGSTDSVGKKKFDLVIANILAGPLKEMAEDITALVKEDGALILSGFLAVQQEALERAYDGLSSRLGRPYALKKLSEAKDPTRISAEGMYCPQDEWVCFVWSNVLKNDK